MKRPLRRNGGKAKWFLLFLVVLFAGGTYAYLRWFREPTELPPVVLVATSVEGTLLGEPLEITVYSEEIGETKRQLNESLAELTKLEQSLVTNLESFNSSLAREWHPVSTDLLELLSHALEIAKLTAGAYDPTLGSLSQLWLESSAKRELPPVDLVTRAQFVTGWEYLQLDLPSRSAKSLREGLIVDPGPLLKAYLLDKGYEILRSKNLSTARLVSGNQIRCGLAPQGSSGWQVLLPDSAGQLNNVITVSNCAISSQGPSSQALFGNFDKQVDPISGHGLPVDSGVTIVAPRGVMSSTLAVAGRVNPTYVTKLSSATDIHSRVISSTGTETSPAFPTIEPYLPSK